AFAYSTYQAAPSSSDIPHPIPLCVRCQTSPRKQAMVVPHRQTGRCPSITYPHPPDRRRRAAPSPESCCVTLDVNNVSLRRPLMSANPQVSQPDDCGGVDERLPMGRLATLGLQHVMVMYAGAVAVPLIIGEALGLTKDQIALLINADL